ncbi:MAG: nucleoside-triphosphatase [Bacteroidales bacterium]
MKNKHKLDDKWIKASIVGTIWAASEIVLGSFLHNLKVPFSGNVLTAIGIIILISVSYIWTEKGLFWRAGLICAIMKTMSPSAVIFGPMIAIFSEALLLEISVRIFGRTLAGFFLGAMMAMSWNLFQKIMNFIIFYGFNIVELYKGLVKYSQKQLGIQTDLFWLPVIALLVLYCLFGLISAIIGIKVGRKILQQPVPEKPAKVPDSPMDTKTKEKPAFDYSMTWLFADILLIISSLILLNNTGWIYWSTFITGVVAIWAFRYKRALRQLSKPKFWVFFVIITMITAFVFSTGQSASNSLEHGLMIGIQMNFRAVIIIVGFAVLGTELYNPAIREYFLRTYFKQLPMALELSFESLPLMIANIPEFKVILRNPVSVIYQVIAQAEYRLAEIKGKLVRNVFIIAGEIGQGKTTCLIRLIEELKAENISVGGIYSPRIMEGDATIGYDLVNISDHTREKYLRISGDESLSNIGKYSILPSGQSFGYEAFAVSGIDVMIMDEVGMLELENKGWAKNLNELLIASKSHLVLSVRDSFLERVIQKWNLENYTICNLHEMDCTAISEMIIQKIK